MTQNFGATTNDRIHNRGIGSSLEEATDDLISHGRPDPQQTTWSTTYDRNHADDPNRADDRIHADDRNQRRRP
jgi:hypothetical protein